MQVTVDADLLREAGGDLYIDFTLPDGKGQEVTLSGYSVSEKCITAFSTHAGQLGHGG